MENLITEGRYDKVTGELARLVMLSARKGRKTLRTRIVLFTRTFIDISVRFKYVDYDDTAVGGGALPNKIFLTVELPADEGSRFRLFTKLLPELKDTIRHEIEHITQHRFKDRQRKGFFSQKREYPKHLSYFEYLTEPYEVEAYVRGLYKKAKTLRQPLNLLMDEWWQYLESRQHLNKDELEKTKDLWVGYAIKHLAKNSQRQYGYDTKEPLSNYIDINEEALGFRYSTRTPDVNGLITFDAPGAGDITDILTNIVKKNNTEIISIKCGSGKFNSCRVEVKVFNDRDIDNLVNDFHRVLLVNHGIKIENVITQIN
jgi:hypothetical protein